jgi:chromosome segregation ATPase
VVDDLNERISECDDEIYERKSELDAVIENKNLELTRKYARRERKEQKVLDMQETLKQFKFDKEHVKEAIKNFENLLEDLEVEKQSLISNAQQVTQALSEIKQELKMKSLVVEKIQMTKIQQNNAQFKSVGKH